MKSNYQFCVFPHRADLFLDPPRWGPGEIVDGVFRLGKMGFLNKNTILSCFFIGGSVVVLFLFGSLATLVLLIPGLVLFASEVKFYFSGSASPVTVDVSGLWVDGKLQGRLNALRVLIAHNVIDLASDGRTRNPDLPLSVWACLYAETESNGSVAVIGDKAGGYYVLPAAKMMSDYCGVRLLVEVKTDQVG